MSRNRNVRIVIVSNVATQAEAFLRQIKNTIETDDDFRSYVGNLLPRYPEKWTNSEIIIERNIKEKDPTISTVGTGGAILSKRADVIICDDLLNKENTKTPEQREKVIEWFNDILMPVLDPNGLLIFMGTVFHTHDLASKLLEDPTFDYKNKYVAVLKEPKSDKSIEVIGEYRKTQLSEGKDKANEYWQNNGYIVEEEAEVLWPQRWSYKLLLDEKISVGTRSFNLMYMNDARNEEDAVFKESWIESSKNTNYALIDRFSADVDVYGITAIATGVDLAISKRKTSNLTVAVTLGKTRNNKIIPLNMISGKGWSPNTIRSNIRGQAERFKSDIVIVENNAFQDFLVKDMQDSSILPIKGFQTTGNKFDEITGINGMAVTVENGQWIFPASPQDPRSVHFYEILKDAMLGFPGGHTPDELMATWFAFVGLLHVSGGSNNSDSIDVDGEIYPEVVVEEKKRSLHNDEPWEEDNDDVVDLD